MAINVITVSGHIGKDCELRYTPNGKAVGSFSIPAVTGWGDKQKTSWLTCRIFGERAEKLAQYLTKGAPVTVTGAFELAEWTDQQGVKKSLPLILVNDVALQGARQHQQQQGYQPKPQQQPQQYQGGNEYDSDIPF